MLDKVRFAVLGAGYMGQKHARILAKLPNAEILWISGQTEEEVKDICHEVGAKGTTDVSVILRDPAVDVVIVAYPTFLHREVTVQALDAGKKVICEKPIALTLEDADEMLEAAGKAALATDIWSDDPAELAAHYLMVGQVVRFWPEYAKILELVEAGVLGRVLTVELERLSVAPGWSNWFKDASRSGGMVVDLMVHDFDIASGLLGQPCSVTAYGVQDMEGIWRHAKTLVTYEEGRQALVIGSHLMPESYPFTSVIRVIGDKATAEYRFVAEGTDAEKNPDARQDQLRVYHTASSKQGVLDEVVPVEAMDPYECQLRYFTDCIQRGMPARRGTPDQARTALAIALAAQKSMAKGSIETLLPEPTECFRGRGKRLDKLGRKMIS
ncbi:MAG: Gfo/Idh/MocA family oxidoreductase [Firmicutes bacterium]|nr:Gfo/Idh/MocA family oxidoreductase [Bacillota bacterium]